MSLVFPSFKNTFWLSHDWRKYLEEYGSQQQSTSYEIFTFSSGTPEQFRCRDSSPSFIADSPGWRDNQHHYCVGGKCWVTNTTIKGSNLTKVFSWVFLDPRGRCYDSDVKWTIISFKLRNRRRGWLSNHMVCEVNCRSIRHNPWRLITKFVTATNWSLRSLTQMNPVHVSEMCFFQIYFSHNPYQTHDFPSGFSPPHILRPKFLIYF